MSEKKETKTILLSHLREQVNEGMKLKQLAEYYEIPVAQMKRILKQANLRIRSFKGAPVVLIDDEETVESTVEMAIERDAPKMEPENEEEAPNPNKVLKPNYNF